MKKSKLGPRALWRALTAISGILLAIAVGGTAVTAEWAGYINQALNVSNTMIVQDPNSNEDPYRYTSDFTKYTDTMDHARSVAKQLQAEGTVLMTNENNALPLAKGSKVTILGYSSAEPALGGTGSGGVSASEERKIDLFEACAEDGKLVVNPTMKQFYQDKYDSGYMVRPESEAWGNVIPACLDRVIGGAIPEINASEFTSAVTGSFNDYSDAAIFIISRIGSEGSDLIKTSASEEAAASRYLQLSADEISVLEAMKNGPFAKRIVLVNTFNAVELGELEKYNIDACLYIGGPGEVGFSAVTDILTGVTNPSGKLADTYAYHSFSSPAMANFGDFTYTNADQLTSKTTQKYLVYSEGIYVGYRYYETRYEDAVLNQGQATSQAGAWASSGNWSYAEEVQFPFGHGLSYTTFTQTLDSVDVNWNAKTATVTVTVKNTGSAAGKDVVEIYAQAPYTPGGIEKSAIQLVGFAKTNLLEPNATQTITCTVELRDLASYDYQNYKTYVLEAGDYYFAIGSDAHDALNNILAAKGKTVSDGMTANGDAGKTHKATKSSFDKDEYRLSPTNYNITNQFETADLNYYMSGAVNYLSRNDWSGTWPKTLNGLAATSQMVDELNSYVTTEEAKAPSAYTKGSADTSSITYGAPATYNLAMMVGVDYDDPAWDALLDQLTLQDYLDGTRQGRVAIAAIGLPDTTAVDGPSAWTKSNYITDWKSLASERENTGEFCVSYPTETIIAGTWNVELAKAMGTSIGEEALWSGNTGWYGPAANTHRTPYAGRNFEYYSEDGFISGKLAESVVHGAMSKGVICYLKHFFTNDQETNRISVCTFSNEQALREVYLRAFQYAFETTGENDPSCNGVMGAFNRLGLIWSGHHQNLWKNVMEGEFGFTGNITTDFGQNPTGLMEPQLAYEAGTTMFCTSGTSFAAYTEGLILNDAKLFGNMREAMHRNLYNLANSNATNGVSSNARVVTVRVWYENVLLGLTIASAALLVISGGITVLQAFGKKKED